MKKVWLGLLLVFVGCVPQAVEDSDLGSREEADGEIEYLESLPEDFARLTIPYLREMDFPGSEIRIERSVDGGEGYGQMVASYESEGLRINGLLTKPEGEAPEGGWPAVVFVHGYIPPLEYKTTEKYVEYVGGLAGEGLVVYKIDLRGHGGSGGVANGAYFSGDYVVDILNAYASLAKLSYVNSEKIGLWGHSMAGNLVLRAMAVKPEIPVGVIWAGAVYTYEDMREYGIADASYEPSQNAGRSRREKMWETVGEVDGGSRFWQMVAPANYLTDLEGRVELHHAVNDVVVSVEYARNLERLMQAVGMDYGLYEYPSGGHNLTSPAFEEAMRLTVKAYREM